MSCLDLIDIRLHNLQNGQCISIDSPSDKTLLEISQFLRQNVGIVDQDI